MPTHGNAPDIILLISPCSSGIKVITKPIRPYPVNTASALVVVAGHEHRPTVSGIAFAFMRESGGISHRIEFFFLI
jgi:hypothetical protein